MKPQNLFPLAAAITTIGLLAGCSPKTEQKLPPPAVVVQSVVQQDVPMQYEFTAQTAGSRQIEIRPRVNGILLKRYFKEGSAVNAGDLLYQIDPSDFKTALAQSEAQLQQLVATLNQNQRDYARNKALLADNAVSRKDVDDAQSAIERTEAQINAAKAQVEQAKLNLSYTRIVAPVSGITSISQMAEGSLVNGPQTLLTNMVQVDPIYVMFSLSENDKLAFDRALQSGKVVVAKGNKSIDVQVKLSDGSVYPFPGKINFADTFFSQTTGTLQMRAEFPNAKNKLVPGQFAKVTIKGMTAPNAILIPQKAVASTANGSVVYVVDQSGKAEAHPVVLRGTHGSDVFVDSGLAVGDRLVVEGVAKVQPGKPVTIVPAQSASGVASAPAGK